MPEKRIKDLTNKAAPELTDRLALDNATGSFSATLENYLKKVPVDDTTIERDGSGNLQIPDGGVDTDQLANDAVDAAKLDDAAVSGVQREYTKSQNFDEATLTDAATIAWNLETQQVATVTLGGNRTLGAPSNLTAGLACVLRVVQDGTGSRTLDYHSGYHFVGKAKPTLTTDASAVDILYFYCDGTRLILTGTSLNCGAAS